MDSGRDDDITKAEVVRGDTACNTDDEKPAGLQVLQEVVGCGLCLTIPLFKAAQHGNKVGASVRQIDSAEIVMSSSNHASGGGEAGKHRLKLVLADRDDAEVDFACNLAQVHCPASLVPSIHDREGVEPRHSPLTARRQVERGACWRGTWNEPV